MAVSYQEIGRRIASYRNQLGLSQEVVAERMGISRAVLSKIENGQKAINAMELQAACTALGLDLNDLIEERPQSLVLAFMGSAKTEPARQAIISVDRLVQEYTWQLRIAEGESPC
jgi:transcriptional regulator with XRE-family HTH domain